MRQTRTTRSYGSGFDFLESEEHFREFLSWWNDKSFFRIKASKTANPARHAAMAA